jgi:hypothetical protein
MQYNIKNDGKLHTRFTDLNRATPRQVIDIIREQTGEKKRFESKTLTFGETRHEMWEAEARKTGRIPRCFAEAFPEYDFEVDPADVERQLATEIYKNIVLHSRLDSLARKAGIIIDYKTQKKGAGGARIYKNSKQLPTYAWHLALHNIRIKQVIYLVEIWEFDENGDPVSVVGYEKFVKDLGLADIHNSKGWVNGRCEVLAEGMRIAGIWND